jgi:hypothetical protein
MRTIKVVLDFVRLAVILLVEFAKNVVVKMTGNPSFPNPDPSLAEITSAVNELETAITNADGGGKLLKAQMRQAAKKLRDLLRKLAAYVDHIADHDETVILSSGFHTSKRPDPTLRPEFWARAGVNSGTIVAGHKAIKKAKAYIWQINVSEDPYSEEGWVFVGFSTQSRCVLSNLEVGKAVWFRCCAITSAGLTPYSDPVCRYIA